MNFLWRFNMMGYTRHYSLIQLTTSHLHRNFIKEPRSGIKPTLHYNNKALRQSTPSYRPPSCRTSTRKSSSTSWWARNGRKDVEMPLSHTPIMLRFVTLANTHSCGIFSWLRFAFYDSALDCLGIFSSIRKRSSTPPNCHLLFVGFLRLHSSFAAVAPSWNRTLRWIIRLVRVEWIIKSPAIRPKHPVRHQQTTIYCRDQHCACTTHNNRCCHSLADGSVSRLGLPQKKRAKYQSFLL